MSDAATEMSIILAGKKLSQREVARRSNVNVSVISRLLDGKPFTLETALKVFIGLQSSLKTHERLSLMESLGLDPLLRQIDWSGITDMKFIDAENKQDLIAAQMYTQAHRIAVDSWKAAIPIFESIELLLGNLSNFAAKAAIDVILMYINLGDSQNAQLKAKHTSLVYGPILDPNMQIKLQAVTGWTYITKGDLNTAEKYFMNCVELSDLYQRSDLGKHALHKLAVMYGASNQTPQRIASALAYHKKIHAISLTEGNDWWDTYAQFRYAQTLHNAGDFDAAKYHRTQSSAAFGDDIGQYHIVLENAKLALEDGEDTKRIQFKILETLDARATIGYKGGLVKGLKMLSLAHLLDGEVSLAFVACSSAILMSKGLSLDPKDTSKHLMKTQILPIMKHQYTSRISLNQKLNLFSRSAHHRVGYYRYLKAITTPTQNEINEYIDTLFASF